jgi:hypothetical protein
MNLGKLVIPASLSVANLSAMAVAQPKLDDVFKSIQTSTQGEPIDNSRIIACMLLVIALALGYTAAKNWSKRSGRPRVLHNHKKLMRATCRATGLSRRKLRVIAPLAEAQGLSSPLVAAVCPSVLKKLAGSARTDAQRRALADVARELVDHRAG